MFKSEKEELEFYRKIHKNMNAVIYVLNLSPYKIDWITDNAMVNNVLGLSSLQVIEKGEHIVAKLLSNTDYQESVEIAVEKFNHNPKIEWAGVYRVKHTNDTHKWIIYSTSTLEQDATGIPTKAVCVAFDPNHLLNTPKTLDDFLKHIKSIRYRHIKEKLTGRQHSIIKLIIQDKTEREISKILNLSVYTIQDHKKAIYKKLNCKSTKELYALSKEFLLG